MVPIEQVATVNPRSSNAQLSNDEPISFVPMAAVRESGELCGVIERPASEVKKGFTSFQRGDVLVAKITPCMENGKAVWTKDLPTQFGFGSTEFHVLRPGPELDPQFLFFMVWHPRFRSEAAKNMTGSAGQKRVPSQFLASYEIPLPPLAEQRRIAAILDKADALRRKAQQALDLTDDLIRSTFLDMFGDPVTNPKGWPEMGLEAFCRPRQWKTIPGKDLLEEGFPVFGANGLIGYYNEYNHEDPVVAITCRGATCGRINVTPPKCYVTGNAMCLDDLDANQMTPEFLEWVLRLRGVRESITGSAQPQITRESLRAVSVITPKKTEQSPFADFLNIVRASDADRRDQLECARHLFDSCLQRAFIGGL